MGRREGRQQAAPEVQRRIDALAGNEEAVTAIGEAIEEVVARFEPASIRTNEEIRTSLPTGENAERHFAEREAATMEAAVERLTVAVEQRLAPGNEHREMDGGLAEAADRVIAATRAKSRGNTQEDVATLVANATRYLDEAPERTQEEERLHRERLAILMPSLTSPRSIEAQVGSTLLTSDFFHYRSRTEPMLFTSNAGVDDVLRGILDRIRHHIVEVGLPPINTPVMHLIFFELIANALFTSGLSRNAVRPHEAWIRAGLSVEQAIDIDPITVEACEVWYNGLVALDPDRLQEGVSSAQRMKLPKM